MAPLQKVIGLTAFLKDIKLQRKKKYSQIIQTPETVIKYQLKRKKIINRLRKKMSEVFKVDNFIQNTEKGYKII